MIDPVTHWWLDAKTMNHELLSLIRESGYLSAADLTAQQRYDLLTKPFWDQAKVLGYDIPDLRRRLWRAAGRPEAELIRSLPEAEIQKAVRQSKEKDPRKRIKETAALIALLYKKAEKDLQAAIDDNLEDPERMRAETGRIRRNLLLQAANWLGVAVPGMYLAGSKASWLTGPHAKAAQAMATQEYNRFKEVDQTIGRHVEEVIAEAEKRRVQAALSSSQAKVDYAGLRGRVIGHKTIEGHELGLSDYIKMVALTAARNIFNQGVENTMTENGSDLALISREVRANSCDSCRQWAGKIISISGKDPKYPSYDDARAANVFHPRCIHYLVDIN